MTNMTKYANLDPPRHEILSSNGATQTKLKDSNKLLREKNDRKRRKLTSPHAKNQTAA